MRTPPLPADFTHARPRKPFCEKSLTLPCGQAVPWSQRDSESPRKSYKNPPFSIENGGFLVDNTELEPVTSRTSSDPGTFF